MVPMRSSYIPTQTQAKWKSALNLTADIFAAETVENPCSDFGVDPLTKDKFDELDVENKGRLGKTKLLELIQWLFQRSPEQALLFAREFELSCEHDDTMVFQTHIFVRVKVVCCYMHVSRSRFRSSARSTA